MAHAPQLAKRPLSWGELGLCCLFAPSQHRFFFPWGQDSEAYAPHLAKFQLSWQSLDFIACAPQPAAPLFWWPGLQGSIPERGLQFPSSLLDSPSNREPKCKLAHGCDLLCSGDPNYDSQAIMVGFKLYIELHVNKPLLQLSVMANLIL